ncbi:MAG: glycosyltransferase [Bacteroidota bacterium]
MRSFDPSKPKLAIVLSRFPFPLEKGDKLRAYYQIKELAESYNIFLLAISRENVTEESKKMLDEFCCEIQIYPQNIFWVAYGLFRSVLNGQPFQVGYFFNPLSKRKILQLLTEKQVDHIFCQQIRTTELVKDYHYCPKTLDYMDALSKGMERRLEKEKGLKKILVRSEWNRLKKYERSIFSYFEFKTIISKQDREYVFHPERNEILIVPNGIDTQKFSALDLPKTHDLVFVGNLSYVPNIEAVQMIEKVLQLLPNVTCLIAGAEESHAVRKIADKNPQIDLIGWVDDTRKAYCSAKIFIAPMMINVGMQNKLLEAMCLQMPCITTTLANNAINAVNNETVLLADDAQQFAKHVADLLQHPEKAQKIGHNAKIFVDATYTWKRSLKSLVDNWKN